MKITVVGLGLLGGSFALKIKQKEKTNRITGVDINEDHARIALEAGMVDEIATLDESLAGAELVILATPVDVIKKELPGILDKVSATAIVMDLGSTKMQIIESVRNHPKRKQFIPAHPIAGTENSGPDAAFADLIRDRIMIFCDKADSDPVMSTFMEAFCKMLDMKVIHMKSEQHDRHLAYVSHLSHISAFALGLTVLHKEKDERTIFQMAGSGFSSTVRLAKSAASMWSPIFSQNKENVVSALDDYIQQLKVFQHIIKNDDVEGSAMLMNEANDIRRILLAIDLNK